MKFSILLISVGVFIAFAHGGTIEQFNEVEMPELEMDLKLLGMTDGIVDSALAFFNGIVNQVKSVIESLAKKAQDTINSTRGKIENIIIAAEASLKKIVLNVEDKITKLASQSAVAMKCVETYLSQVETIPGYAVAELRECGSNGISHVEGVVNAIKEYIDVINDAMDNAKDTIQDCTETNGSVWGMITCITSKTNEFRKTIFEMVGKAEDTIVDGIKDSFKAVAGTQYCIGKVIANANIEAFAILKNATVCTVSR